MKIEEAICVLQSRIEYPEDDTYGGMCERDYQREAIDIAIVALHEKLEREKGCLRCNSKNYSTVGVDEHGIYLCGGNSEPPDDERFLFCPRCGRSLGAVSEPQ